MKLKLFIVALFCSVVGWGQVTMTTTGSYSQNFDGLINTSSGTWTDNSTIANWYSQRSGTGTTITSGTGSSATGDLYSFGAASGNTERALGSVGTGNAAAGSFAHGMLLRNTSGTVITDIKVSYKMEQWRNSAAAAQTISFYYKISSTSFTPLDPNNNTGWTAVAALNANSPITGGTAGVLNGNLGANQVSLTGIAIPSLNLAAGDYIMIKWDDPDHSGSDHGLSIDDVIVDWTVTPATCATPTIGTNPSTTIQNLCVGASATALTVAATGSPTLTYQWYSNTANSNVGGTLIAGATSSSYTPSTAAAGTLYYYCEVGSTCLPTPTPAVSAVSGAVNVNAVPATPTGTINVSANPSCGPATLTYSAPNANIYWQTTAGGTLTGSPTTSSYTSSAAAGSYTVYVRELSGTCWGPATSVTFTVVAPVNITAQPPNRVVNDGVNTTFTVSATGTGLTFQWQVDTGSGFNNITLAAPYSESTTGGATRTSTLTITNVPISMNGYLYRCIVSGASPCGSVTSNVGTLTVNYTAPNNPTNITPCYGNNTLGLSWTASSGGAAPDGYMVFALEGATTPAATSAVAGNATLYTANSDFSLASVVTASLGKCIYKGTGTSFTVTGLTNLSNYSFKVVAYRGATGTAWSSGINTSASWNTPTTNIVIDMPEVSALSASIASGQSALTWNRPTPLACYDQYLVVANQGAVVFTPSGDGTAYIPNTVYSGPNQVVYNGTGAGVTVTGLTNGTNYCYKVFVRRGTEWSDGVTVCQTPNIVYCASGATNSTNSEIENVTLVGYSSTISNNTTNACTTGVNNYTAMSADLAVGGSYTLTVEFGDCNGGTQYNGAGGVWIDWNNDGDFDDANETIGTTLVAVSGGNVIQNFTINVPIAQSLGFYRMRIVQRESGTLSNISPCGTFSWGSTEDYTIEVINACTPTTSVSSIFPTSGPVGTVVTINGSGFTTATSVSFGSVVASFNIISNTVIEVIVPTGATTGNIVIQDAGSCNLSYSSFTVITKDISSCEGAPITTDLIIYELHDEFTGDGGFITLYNGTAATVNLSNYRIYRAGDYGAAISNYATLTGSIAPGALGVVTVDAASCGNATNGDLNAGFNENDQIQLRNAAGTIVIDDVHAYIPGPGYYMVRNAGALSARTTFVAADWSTTPLVAGQCILSAGLVPPSGTGDSPAVTLNPIDVNASCSSSTATLSVAGTEGVAGGATLAYQWYVNVPGNAGWTAVANGGVYSGATTTTLNISSTSGLNNYQYYCQIRENDATCYTATEAAIVKEGATIWDGTSWSNGVPTLTKLAIINGNYDTTANGNFSCCSLIVNASFVLDIRANDYVEIQNDLTVNGTLNVFNNGSLVQVNDLGVNTGNISYQRIASSVKLQDYVYWSSPVSGFDVNSISPLTPAYYHWQWNPTILNPNGGEGNWVNASTTMLAGQGYIVRAPNGFSNTVNQNWTATFNNGVANNGVYSPSIARGNDLNAGTPGPNGIMRTVTDDNWNLLGNPYPSAISINSFLLANPDLDGFVRLWTHGNLPTYTVDPFYNNFVYNYTADDYIAINGAGATSGPGTLSVIGGGQGFFVLMNPGTATTSTATFNNAMRNIGYSNSQFYRSANVTNAGVGGDIERHRIWLDLISPTNETTRTLVAYVEGATLAKDRMFDAFTDYKLAQNFYSLIDDQIMTIQGRGLPFNQEDRVPLGVKIPSNGIYKIAIATVDGLFSSNQAIYLEDTALGIIHDLRQAPYTFTGTSGIVNNRFVLRYTNETLGNDDFITSSDVLISSSDVITVYSSNETIQSIQIHNVLGQLLVNQKNVNADTFEINTLQKNKAPLIIQVTLENGKKIAKKLIF